MKRQIGLVMFSMILAADAAAQPVIDGTADASYGVALSTQNTRTGFGDGPVGGNPDPIMTGLNFAQNGGSELDQVFATVANGRLYVTIAGNLEENFNKLDVFIDSVTGGVNQINGANLPSGVDGFCCGGFTGDRGSNAANIGALQRMNGMRFDAGFDADYALIFTHGGESVGPTHGNYNQTAANQDVVIDAADYTVWRDKLGQPVDNLTNRPSNTGVIDENEYDTWKSNFGLKQTPFWAMSAHFAELNEEVGGAVGALGMQLAPRGAPRVLRAATAPGLGDAPVRPSGNPGNTDQLLSSYTLAGLGQGELIDRDYALGAGGCDDDSGTGCLAREFEFALDVKPGEIGTEFPNNSSHRNFDNIIDLQMALDNSNVAGVRGSGGPFDLVEGEDDPGVVRTGIEFSIPLSAIGNPTGNIRIAAMINNGNHDYLSNQVSGVGIVNYDGPGTGANLEDDFFGAAPVGSFLDLPGDQFVTLVQAVAGGGAVAGVPEPSSSVVALVGLIVGGVTMRRRR